uniref:Uncharacterized protein n=1 Tax=Meloidogyne incognita TaxID=6306 RepID=A0A914M6Q3_MELIC
MVREVFNYLLSIGRFIIRESEALFHHYEQLMQLLLNQKLQKKEEYIQEKNF